MDLAREPKLTLGRIDVSPATREVIFPGGREVLEPRVMEVLVTLAHANGNVLSRDNLIEVCWQGRAISDDALNRVISRVRKVSELTHGEDFVLETIAKVGYRLVIKQAAPTAVAGLREELAQTPESNDPGAQRSTAPMRSTRLTPWLLTVMGLLIAALVGAFVISNNEARQPAAKADADAENALTLAVMPFDALSANEGDDLLATGMSREIRNTLSRVRGLQVVSDASSSAAAGQMMSARDIGAKSWADLVIEGSFSRTGDTVKLTAELVDAKTGINVWAGEKSGEEADLDRLRGLMSAALFEQIVARVGPNRLQQLAPPRPMDPRVYRLTLEARQIFSGQALVRRRGGQEESLDAGDKVDALLDQALAIEADNPAALVLKGMLHMSSSTHELRRSGATLQERQAQAAEFFRRALAVDPDNVDALLNLAEHYRRNEWRWREARQLFERALAVDPNSHDARLYWSWYLSATGRCLEAMEQVRIVNYLNPAEHAHTVEARVLKCLGRLEASDKVYMGMLESDRENLFILSEHYLGLLVRRDASLLRQLTRHVGDDLWEGKPSALVAKWLERIAFAADALEGRPEAFVRLLEEDLRTFEKDERAEIGRRGADRYWTFALEYAHAGKTSRAIDLLSRALTEGSLYIPETMPYGQWEFTQQMRTDPRYQTLWRGDPRLVELMALRLDALKTRQFTGVMPDGTRSEALPVDMKNDGAPI